MRQSIGSVTAPCPGVSCPGRGRGRPRHDLAAEFQALVAHGPARDELAHFLLTSMTEATGQEIGTLAAEDPIRGFPADAPARQPPRPPTRRAGRVAEQRPRTALASTSAAVFRVRRRARTNDPGGTGYGAPGPGKVLALHTDAHAVDFSLPCRLGPATPCSAASTVISSSRPGAPSSCSGRWPSSHGHAHCLRPAGGATGIGTTDCRRRPGDGVPRPGTAKQPAPGTVTNGVDRAQRSATSSGGTTA